MKYDAVLRMGDYEWVAIPEGMEIEEAIAWFNNEFYSDLIEADVEECNIDTEGQWIPLEDTAKIADLEAEGVTEVKAESEKPSFGDIQKHDGEWWQFVPFRRVIESMEGTEPEVIASTEW